MDMFALSGANVCPPLSAPPLRIVRPRSIGPYPGASPALAAVLEQITGLSQADQAALVGAVRLATQPPQQLRIAVKTFKGYEDFMPAFTAARLAAREAAGDRWDLDPNARICARLPSAWVSCKIFGGTKRSPRDVAFPRAKFWPDGILPVGPEYAELGPLEPNHDVHAWKMARALNHRPMVAPEHSAETADDRPIGQRTGDCHAAPEACDHDNFVLEHSPDGEMDTSDLEIVG